MLFPTLTFAVFFAIVFPLNWLLRPPRRAWKLFILAASYVFYAYWDWRFLGLIVGSTLANAFFARRIAGRRDRGRKLWMALALAFNLGLLGFFKYYGFFVDSLDLALRPLGLASGLPYLEIILPVGISFYTFQALSYVIDVYRGLVRPSPLLDLAVYLAFFPHLVAGPIVRASEFLPQLLQPVRLYRADATRAGLLIAAGAFKKVVVSTYLAGAIVDPVFALPEAHSRAEILMAVYGYAIQIYADFSGYTDIAIGLALLLGFRFPQNFDRPYAAVSIRDFWRRWHMTLSRWLRDYLYIPLGGNRKGDFKTYRNLMLTMVLGGLWHGAAATFLVWGAFHGALLSLEHFRDSRRRRRLPPASRGPAALPATPASAAAGDGGEAPAAAPSAPPEAEAGVPSRRARAWLAWFISFQLVCVGWVFFRAESMDLALAMFRGLASGGPAPLVTPGVLLATFGMLAIQLLPPGWAGRVEAAFGRLPLPAQGALVGLAFFATAALGPEGVLPFIYFQF